MAIVQSFFDQQKAGEINAIINNNFKNVAKYIPVHFDTLTTVERLNLTADWKEDGKLVYDIDQDMIYIWDAESLEWAEKLLEAQDSKARGEVAELQREAYANVELNSDCELIFKNIWGDIVDRQLLSADKIQYDSADTVRSKILALIQKDTDIEKKLDDFIDDTNTTIGTTPLPTTSKTLTGAINEIHSELDTTVDKVDKILDGTTVVPEAQHATNADLAKDSERLGGELPEFYAKQSDLDVTNSNVATNSTDISTNRTDIQKLRDDLTSTNNTVEAHWNDYNTTKTIVMDHDTRLDTVENEMESLKGSIIPKGSVSTVNENNPDEDLTQYIYDTYFATETLKYVGKTPLTAGNENTELNQYMTGLGKTPSTNDTVIDTNTCSAWKFNGTDWEDTTITIKSGWAVRDSATSDMWVYETENAEWINFGGSFEIQIANTTKAGIVMATADVNVDPQTGAMTIPKLSGLASSADAITSATTTATTDGKGNLLEFKNSAGTTKSSVTLNRTDTSHKIQGDSAVLNDRTTLQFKGNVELTEDTANDKIVVNVTGGNGSLTDVKLVDDEYIIELTASKAAYTTPILKDYNKDTDTIKLFMNGAYISKTNYSISVDSSNVATITNSNHTDFPWLEGWEMLVLVTRIVKTTTPATK